MILFFLQGNSPPQPVNVEASLVQIQEASDNVRVVVEESVHAGTTLTVTPPQLACFRIIEMHFKKLRRGLRVLQIERFIESLAGPRESGDHHSIPCCDNLIVERGPWTSRTRFEQGFSSCSQLLCSLYNSQTKFLRGFLR